MRISFDRRVFLLTAAICLGSAGVSRADLLINGDFETGDFTGWSVTGNTSDPSTFGVDGSFPHTGDFAAYFGPQETEAFLIQTVTTVPGFAYEVDFYLQNEDGSSPNAFKAEFGSTVLVDSTNLPTFSYTHMSFLVAATEASTTLKFSFRNDFAFFDIDDIRVLRVIPEPGSLACLGIGLGLAGFYGWRKRTARPSA